VTTPVLLAAYHRQNAVAIRKLEIEQAGCSQSMLSLESKEHTARALPQEAEHSLEPKREPLRHFRMHSRCHPRTKEVLDPNNYAQKGTKT